MSHDHYMSLISGDGKPGQKTFAPIDPIVCVN